MFRRFLRYFLLDEAPPPAPPCFAHMPLMQRPDLLAVHIVNATWRSRALQWRL